MTTTLRARLPITLTLVAFFAIVAPTPRALAHGGEDHGAPAAAATTTTGGLRKIEATTLRIAVLLEIPVASASHPQLLRVFLSDPETNVAVANARVKLRIADLKLDLDVPASTRLPGLHEVMATPGMGGTHAVVVGITSPTHGDLVAFDSVAFGLDQPKASPSLWQRFLAAIGLGADEEHSDAALPSAGGASAVTSATVSKEAQFLFALNTARATASSLQARTKLAGTIVAPPDASAQVIAPQAGQTLPIDGVIPRIGDHVRAGQPLVLLEGLLSSEERVSASAALAEGDARVIAASRELDLAERELARAEALPQVVSQRDREAAVARVESARAGRDAARRSSSILRNALAGGPGSATRVVLTSPISGVITQAHVAVGEIAEAGHVLFHAIDPDRLVVRADIPERDVSSLEFTVGASATIVSRVAVGLTAEATMTSHSRAIDPATRSVPVFFDLKPGSRFLDGMVVDVRVDRGSRVKGFVLPVSAVARLGSGRDVVFVKIAAERFEPHDVTLGVTDGQSVEVLNGLDGGELVVINGVSRVRAALLAPGQ